METKMNLIRNVRTESHKKCKDGKLYENWIEVRAELARKNEIFEFFRNSSWLVKFGKFY